MPNNIPENSRRQYTDIHVKHIEDVVTSLELRCMNVLLQRRRLYNALVEHALRRPKHCHLFHTVVIAVAGRHGMFFNLLHHR